MVHEFAREIAAECLAGRVRMLNRVVTGIYDGKLRPCGLRSSQFGILTVIAARGPLSPTEVCRVMRLEKSTLSRDLERITAHGWVESTPGAGRSVRLEITDEGRAILLKAKPAWDEAQAEVRKILGGALIRELHRTADDIRLCDLGDR